MNPSNSTNTSDRWYQKFFFCPTGTSNNVSRDWCERNLTKTFSLLTTVKCKMDFQNFPFDKHTCNIEVSITSGMI